MTWNSTLNVHGPICTSISINPIISHLVPSKALTTILLCFMQDLSTGNLIRVDKGMTFNDDPLSIRTLGKVQSLTLVVMCKALVLLRPFGECRRPILSELLCFNFYFFVSLGSICVKVRVWPSDLFHLFYLSSL